jgi:hypothetical protein
MTHIHTDKTSTEIEGEGHKYTHRHHAVVLGNVVVVEHVDEVSLAVETAHVEANDKASR